MLQSKNLRIRGTYNCDADIEENIKKLETQFRFDFKSLPQWKEVIERIHAVQTKCKKKLLNAKTRNFHIIEKLYIENYRASPFELTDTFARTANLWGKNTYNVKQCKTSSTKQRASITPNVSVDNIITSEESDLESNGHPNSEIIQSKEQILKPEIEIDSKLSSPHYLPPNICTNQHKMLSSIGSDNIVLSYKESKNFEKDFKLETTNEVFLNQTKLVKCYPNELMIINSSISEQFLKFSLLNCNTEYVFIRFKNVSDSSYFETFRILPLVPHKLNPGLSKNYKFLFTLRDNIDIDDISSTLTFRIGSKTIEDNLCIPIKGKCDIRNSVSITETVNIPQVYLWQVNAKCGYPKGIVQIQVCGNITYNLHIRKKDVYFISDDTYSTDSFKVNSPNTESLMQKLNEDDVETQDRTLLSPKKMEMNMLDKIITENETIKSFDVVILVLNDILNLVYEPFVFKNTFMRLLPKSKRIILVYFTKAEHIGYHQRYYEFIFYDSDEAVFSKTIKVFAEVLPHPILICPNILDTTKSPVVFGHCKEFVTIINTHKVYPVTITIKTTKKMDKTIQITPRVTSIPAKSRVNFNIKLCREQFLASENLDIMAYFTIKIIVNGHKSVYQNVPPFYYEIIAPCAKEFIENKEEYLKELIE